MVRRRSLLYRPFYRPGCRARRVLQASAVAGLPSIQVSPTQGKLLHLLARLQGAKKILEIGTLGGYSTIWLARALPAGGRLITLEADAKHADVACANLARAGLTDVVELASVRPRRRCPRLAAERQGPFDLIFIDADKDNYPEYFTWSLRLSRRGTLIIADNVVRKGAVVNAASADPDIQGIRRFNELLAAEPRVSATAIQTVGGKGYDGFARCARPLRHRLTFRRCQGRHVRARREQPDVTHLAHIVVTADAVQRQLDIAQGNAVQVLVLRPLNDRLGGAAEFVAVHLVGRRAHHVPFGGIADLDQFLRAGRDLAIIPHDDALEHALGIAELLRHELAQLVALCPSDSIAVQRPLP